MYFRNLPSCFLGWSFIIGFAATGVQKQEVRAEDVGWTVESNEAGPSESVRRLRSLLSSRCFLCHGPDASARQGGFRLDRPQSYLAAADSGIAPVVPGDIESSGVWERITTEDPDSCMPPPQHGPRLTGDEIELVRLWIQQGAEMSEHWSFVAPFRYKPPELPNAEGSAIPSQRIQAWNRPIDRFVLQQQLRNGLTPSPEASKAELLRRVSLDLIGLPPTIAELESFESDDQPNAYERQVDRLLSSPAFGEHWARQWLDLARYADSAGYADDPDRTIWAYRDWLIRAFNDNLPLDRFTIEQLAGDLLPSPTTQQLTATAFHRNTLTNNEGGTNDEEFRNVAVVDRVNTTMAVWMGLTFGCAQCHDHKYDPFSQKEYFQLFAIFNQTQDRDRTDESPTLQLYSDDQLKKRQAWAAELSRDEMLFHQVQALVAEVSTWRAPSDGVQQSSLVSIDIAPSPGTDPLVDLVVNRPGMPMDFLAVGELGWLVEKLQTAYWRVTRLKRQLDSQAPETVVPVMRELAESHQRKTRIHLRGNYRSLGEEVFPATPEILHAVRLDKDNRHATRLELAEWLMDDENPLTARVWVNRMWESLFGLGLVRTSEEFGAQGDAPTHPELLDWLATEMVELEWDFKSMLRVLVTCQTYRQTSQVSHEHLEADAENIWLARGPRVRLTAEMIRDVALFSSGIMSNTMYGEPVLPPQPNQGLRAAFGSATDWQTSEGENRFRRAIYTKWRRSNPYPSMGTFDAPSREVCVLRRDRTNTPLQALVTLNDPVFIEAAQALSRQLAIFENSEVSDEQRLIRGWQYCVSRQPTPRELEATMKLLEDAREHFSTVPDEALQLATEPLGPLPAGADSADLAAWTTVCNVLLNLDEVLMKR